MTYKEQLSDERWYQKREEIKLRDLNKCVKCNSQVKLQVHHTYYEKDLLAWEYPDKCYETLCEKCHQNKHVNKNPLSENLIIKSRSLNNKIFEEDVKTNLYLNVNNRNLLLSLNHIELKFFILLASNLEQGNDEILINETFYVKLLKLKNKRVLRENIEQLIRYGLLAKTTIDHVYWINPHIMFCGNRVKKYPKSVIIR